MNNMEPTDTQYIERLEYCQRPMNCCICKYRGDCYLDNKKTVDLIHRLQDKNAELQKQVDELTEQRNKNYLKGEIIMKDEKTLLNEIKEQCGDCEAWSGTDCTRNPYTQGCLKDEKQVIECHGMLKGCDMVKQAVKDTAKEILQEGKYCLSKSLQEWIKERYGVEVE